MGTYVKKPVEIEAFRWTGGPDQTEGPQWIVDAIKSGEVGFNYVGTSQVEMTILTLEGKMIAKQGDYIIRGIKGELYPCKPEIFEATYDAARVLPEWYEPWQRRLVLEAFDLSERASKLSAYLGGVNGGQLPDPGILARQLLRAQHAAMTTYLIILQTRIRGFVEPEPTA